MTKKSYNYGFFIILWTTIQRIKVT